MEDFVAIIGYLLLGMLLRRVPLFPRETAQALNLFVIYLSLPALILVRVPELAFGPELLIPSVAPWLLLVFSALLVRGAAALWSWPRQVTGAMLLLIPLGNTSFLGIPMVRALLGETAIPYAVVYDQLGSFLALAIYGTVILALYGRGQAAGPRAIAGRILGFPPFLALVAALALRDVPYPAVVSQMLNSLAGTLVVLVMVAVGFQLSFRLAREDLVPLAAGLGIKLIVAPLGLLVVCRLLGLAGLAAKVAILEAGMPPMVSAGAMAIIAGLSPRLTAALIGIGIFLSLGSLPLLAWFLS